jgi:hypothetical protein
MSRRQSKRHYALFQANDESTNESTQYKATHFFLDVLDFCVVQFSLNAAASPTEVCHLVTRSFVLGLKTVHQFSSSLERLTTRRIATSIDMLNKGGISTIILQVGHHNSSE